MSNPIDAKKWIDTINYVTKDYNNHGVICYIGRSQIKVVSQEEYNKTHSFWTQQCDKLTLRDLVKISDSLFPDTYKYEFEDKILINNVKSQNYLSEIETSVNSVADNLKDCSELIPKLREIYDRSKKKHTEEKTKSIWNTIKWYIWSWFFDVKDQIDAFEKKFKMMKLFFVNSIDEAFKIRIEANMDNFAERIGNVVPQFTEDPDNKFKYIQDWIKKYHTDKFSDEMLVQAVEQKIGAESDKKEEYIESAKDSRNRILELLRIWKSVNKDLENALDKLNLNNEID